MPKLRHIRWQLGPMAILKTALRAAQGPVYVDAFVALPNLSGEPAARAHLVDLRLSEPTLDPDRLDEDDEYDDERDRVPAHLRSLVALERFTAVDVDATILDALPPTLRHLSVGRGVRTLAALSAYVADAARSPNLREVEIVRYVVRQGRDEYWTQRIGRRLAAVEAACAARGITVVELAGP